jgi:hypothetical protein
MPHISATEPQLLFAEGADLQFASCVHVDVQMITQLAANELNNRKSLAIAD